MRVILPLLHLRKGERERKKMRKREKVRERGKKKTILSTMYMESFVENIAYVQLNFNLIY